MEDIIELDLNELVSKQVKEAIDGYKSKIESLEKNQSKLNKTIRELKEDKERSNLPLFFIDSIRNTYLNIGSTPKDKDGYGGRTSTENRYSYFCELMKLIFGVKEIKYSHFEKWSLKDSVAIGFYEHKESAIYLYELLNAGGNSTKEDVFRIKSFLMPYDYPYGRIFEYAKNPHYNTNGYVTEVGYWSGGDKNIPHFLLMKSPLFKGEDIFSEVIASIKRGKSDASYFFLIPKYNDLSVEQIQRLGETLTVIDKSWLGIDYVKGFIKKNMLQFNKSTLDYLYSLASCDNQFKTLYWENFPIEYQKRFLMEKPYPEISKIFGYSGCKWTDEEKESFLTEYFKSKP